MNVNDLLLPEELDAKIDTTKKRLEIRLDGENADRIFVYYPIENMQIYVYEVNKPTPPFLRKLGLRMSLSERYLRIFICRRGHGEFIDKGIHLNMSGGEFSLKIGSVDDQFEFRTDSFVGVEIALQVNDAVQKSVLFEKIKASLRSIGVRKEDFWMNQWYFSGYGNETEKAIDRLIETCISGADSALVMIYAAEISYMLGNDYRETGSKGRSYPTNLQKAIAEDMHRQLTEKYGERITAAVFAEKYGMSDSTVKNYFKRVYGYSFKEYQMKVRMEKAAELLTTTDMKQVETAMAVGYATQAKFISAFKKYYLMTPSEYRRLKKLSYVLDT